jgi:sec-independent protein translocase protein TatC
MTTERTERPQKEMPFLDHLEELRRRILVCLGAVVGAAVLCYAFSGFLLTVLTRGAPELVTLTPTEAILTRIKIALVSGLVVVFPVVLWEVWAFVAPGLLSRERRLAAPLIAISVGFFLAGGTFAYLVVWPVAVKVLQTFVVPGVVNRWSVAKYVGLEMRIILAFGAIFQVPVVIFFLTKMGIVTPGFLRRKRPYAIVVILVLAAMLTPPDVLTQLLLALPLVVLFELGIWVSVLAVRERNGAPEQGAKAQDRG